MADATRVKVERCAKRLRVYIGGEIIADSIHAKLVWELTHYPPTISRQQTCVWPTSRKAIAPSARHCSAKRATSTCGTETV